MKSILPRKQGKDSRALSIVTGRQSDTNSIASYILIAEKNIFNPKRKDDFPVAPVEHNKSTVRPPVILHGMTVSEDYKAATTTNPGRPLRKGEGETMTVKIGEKIGEYKLSKTLPDRMTLETSNDSFEVLLYDPKTPKKRIPIQAGSKPPATTTAASPPAQGSVEASKTVSSKEAPGVGTTRGRAVLPPSPRSTATPGQEKTSAPPLPPPTTSPLPTHSLSTTPTFGISATPSPTS